MLLKYKLSCDILQTKSIFNKFCTLVSAKQHTTYGKCVPESPQKFKGRATPNEGERICKDKL